jgi:hypothetical protein
MTDNYGKYVYLALTVLYSTLIRDFGATYGRLKCGVVCDVIG